MEAMERLKCSRAEREAGRARKAVTKVIMVILERK